MISFNAIRYVMGDGSNNGPMSCILENFISSEFDIGSWNISVKQYTIPLALDIAAVMSDVI